MVKKIIKRIANLPRVKKIEVVLAAALTLALVIGIPVFAWFYNERSVGDLERVDTPTKLFITAAHDDIKYLQLNDIKVSDSSENKKYYVFCVSGKSASYYNLQLAYTTNNQFEYFVYPAKQLTTSQVEGGATYQAKHTAHDDNGNETETYYYAIETDPSINNPNNSFSGLEHYRLWSGSVIQQDDRGIVTSYLNKTDGSLIANDTKHNITYHYKEYDSNSPGDSGVGAQLYGEPIYWLAKRIKSGMDASNEFINYYILEINWEKAKEAAGSAGLKDDKETDIIYIIAEATS